VSHFLDYCAMMTVENDNCDIENLSGWVKEDALAALHPHFDRPFSV